MTVRTSITASDVIATFKKWGVPYAAYSQNWATYNRNHKGNWGGIEGIFVHNFASNIADTSSEAYLYRGDASRGMPGPLSQFSLRDNGTVGLIGWGRANHAGYGETRTRSTARANAMPLNGELDPSTSGTEDMNAHYIGIEMLYGGNSATNAQRAGIVLMCAALLDMLGGPAAGYGAGSVVAHRESTNQRSDPEGFSMATLRQQIAARLKAGPVGAKPVTPTAPRPTAPKPAPLPPTNPPIQEDDMPYSPDQIEKYAGVGVHSQNIGRFVDEKGNPVTFAVAAERTMRGVTALTEKVDALAAAVEKLTALVTPVNPAPKP